MKQKVYKNTIIYSYINRIKSITTYSMHLENIDAQLPRAILPISHNENDEYDSISTLFHQSDINPIAIITIRYRDDEFKIKVLNIYQPLETSIMCR